MIAHPMSRNQASICLIREKTLEQFWSIYADTMMHLIHIPSSSLHSHFFDRKRVLKGWSAACWLCGNWQGIAFSLYSKRIKLTKFDQTISCLLAPTTISIGHEIKQTHYKCTTSGGIYKPINEIEQLLAIMGIICPMASNAQMSKKILWIMIIWNLLTLIVAPSALVSVWKNEFQKTILTNVLQLCTAHQRKNSTLKDLYTPYETLDKMENDLRKDNFVVFISKNCLDKRIMANADSYHLLWKKSCKHLIRVGRFLFAQVLVDESHDIWGVNITFFHNLVKLAIDGASIWFITAMPLLKDIRSLTDCINCWDVTALTRQLRDPLASQLADINKDYNTAFCFYSGTLTNKQEEVIYSTWQSIEAEVEKLAMIMLDFTIQWRHETVFLKKNIFHLPPITKKICAIEFQRDYKKSRYVVYNRKNVEDMRRFQVNIGENYVNVLTSIFEYMRRSCIYACIPGHMDILGQWTSGNRMFARKKSAEDGLSTLDSNCFIGQRVFDCSQINLRVQSSKNCSGW